MSLSNTAQFVVSRHRADAGFNYRVHMADGSMRIMTETQTRCCVSGDQSLADFDPMEEFEARSPPTFAGEGPEVNDIIRVQVRNEWIVGTVVDVKPGGIYRVKYDDGMCVQDRLSLPWTYVAVASAPVASSMQSLKIRIRLPEPSPQSTITQLSTKALGKRKMRAGGDPARVTPGPYSHQPAVAQTAQHFHAENVVEMAHAAAADTVGWSAAHAALPAVTQVAKLTDAQIQAVLKNDSMYLGRYDAFLDCL